MSAAVTISQSLPAQVTVQVEGGAAAILAASSPARVEVMSAGPQGGRGLTGADIGNYDPGDLTVAFENGLI